MTPSSELIMKQLEACQDDFNQIAQWLKSFDLAENSLCTFKGPLPATIESSRNGKTSFKRMSGSEFRKALCKFGIEDLFPSRNNAWRHIAASHFNGLVPEVILDELLGHNREGLDFTGHWSTASLTSFKCLNDLLDKLATQLELKVLRIGDFA